MDVACDDGTPLNIARRRGGYVHFELPVNGISRRPWFSCSGWLLADNCQLTFEINGIPVEHVRLHKRDDVKAVHPGADAVGFQFWIDAYRYLRSPSRALHMVVRGREIVTERYFWVPPRDAAEASTSMLTFFLHLPKTAGTAVRLNMEATAAAATPPYEGILAAYDVPELLAMTPQTLLFFDFVFGHFAHGAHKIAPDRPYTYVTVLRDPYERIVSLYHYQKYVEGVVDHRSIYDFLADPESIPKVTNHCARNICGLKRGSIVTPEHVQMAKDNIDRDFAFVGLAEDMPRTLSRLSAILGFDLRQTPRENVSPQTEERLQLDPEAFKSAAYELVKHDLEIYRYVQSKFL